MSRLSTIVRLHFGRVIWVVGLAAFIGCAPPHMNKTNELVSVRVLPAGPSIWTYILQTNSPENMVAVEFVSPSDLSDVTVTPLPEWWEVEELRASNSIRVTLKGSIFGRRAEQFRALTLSLRSKDKNKKNGEIQVRVTDFRGHVTTIQPLAGPV